MRIPWLCLVALCSVACTNTSDPGVSTPVGPEGGTVETDDGVVLDVPAGAVSSEVTITVSETTDAPVPSGGTAVGPMYVLEPEGQTFDAPVTLTLPWSARDLPAGTSSEDLAVYQAPTGTADYVLLVPTEVGDDWVRTEIEHFSTVFVGTRTECDVPCAAGGTGDGSSSTSCGSDVDGATLTLECADGSCECRKDGSTTATFTVDGELDPEESWWDECGFGCTTGSPDDGGVSGPEDGGAGPSADGGAAGSCEPMCATNIYEDEGTVSTECFCQESVGGSILKAHCPRGETTCTCSVDGSTTSTFPKAECDGLAAQWESECGFVCEGGGTATDGGSTSPPDGGASDDGGSAGPTADGGISTDCEPRCDPEACFCEEEVDGSTLRVECEGTACECSVDGSSTVHFEGGSCDELAMHWEGECGFVCE